MIPELRSQSREHDANSSASLVIEYEMMQRKENLISYLVKPTYMRHGDTVSIIRSMKLWFDCALRPSARMKKQNN